MAWVEKEGGGTADKPPKSTGCEYAAQFLVARHESRGGKPDGESRVKEEREAAIRGNVLTPYTAYLRQHETPMAGRDPSPSAGRTDVDAGPDLPELDAGSASGDGFDFDNPFGVGPLEEEPPLDVVDLPLHGTEPDEPPTDDGPAGNPLLVTPMRGVWCEDVCRVLVRYPHASDADTDAPSLVPSHASSHVGTDPWDDVAASTLAMQVADVVLLSNTQVLFGTTHDDVVARLRDKYDVTWPAPAQGNAVQLLHGARGLLRGSAGLEIDVALLLWMLGPQAHAVADLVVQQIHQLWDNGGPRTEGSEATGDARAALHVVVGEACTLHRQLFPDKELLPMRLMAVVLHPAMSPVWKLALTGTWAKHGTLVCRQAAKRGNDQQARWLRIVADVLEEVQGSMDPQTDKMFDREDHVTVLRPLLLDPRHGPSCELPWRHALMSFVQGFLIPPNDKLPPMRMNGVHQALLCTLRHLSSHTSPPSHLERRVASDVSLRGNLVVFNGLCRAAIVAAAAQRVMCKAFSREATAVLTYYENEDVHKRLERDKTNLPPGQARIRARRRNWEQEKEMAHLVLSDVPTAHDVDTRLEYRDDTYQMLLDLNRESKFLVTPLMDALTVLMTDNVLVRDTRTREVRFAKRAGAYEAACDSVHRGAAWTSFTCLRQAVLDKSIPLGADLEDSDISPVVRLLRGYSRSSSMLLALGQQTGCTVDMERAERLLAAKCSGWRVDAKAQTVTLKIGKGLPWLPVWVQNVARVLRDQRVTWATELDNARDIVGKALCFVLHASTGKEKDVAKKREAREVLAVLAHCAWNIGNDERTSVAFLLQMEESPNNYSSLGALLGNGRALLLKGGLAVWQHIDRSDPRCRACANAYKVLVKYKLDLAPLERGTLPNLAVDDPAAWGLMFLVGEFEKLMRVAVHKKLAEPIVRAGTYLDTAQQSTSASSMLPPTGAFDIRRVLCRQIPVFPPPLSLWGLGRPIYAALETSTVTAAREQSCAALVQLLQVMFSRRVHMRLSRKEPFAPAVHAVVAVDHEATAGISEPSWKRRPGLYDALRGIIGPDGTLDAPDPPLPPSQPTDAARRTREKTVRELFVEHRKLLTTLLTIHPAHPIGVFFDPYASVAGQLLFRAVAKTREEAPDPHRFQLAASLSCQIIFTHAAYGAFKVGLIRALNRLLPRFDGGRTIPLQYPRDDDTQMREACLDGWGLDELFEPHGLLCSARAVRQSFERIGVPREHVEAAAQENEEAAQQFLHGLTHEELRRLYALAKFVDPHMAETMQVHSERMKRRIKDPAYFADAPSLAHLLVRLCNLLVWAYLFVK